MKSIFAAALIALAIATTGAVTAQAETGSKLDAGKLFEKIQLFGH